jgi:TP901 family phage tail tape measure protein
VANRGTREEILKFIVATEGDDDIKALAKQLLQLGDTSGASAEKARALLDRIEQLGETSNRLQGFTKLKASLVELGSEITTANRKVAELELQLVRDPDNGKLARSLDKAKAAAIELEKEQNRLQAELARTSNALEKDGVDTKRLGDAYATLQSKLATARGEVASFGSAARNAGQGTTEAGQGMSAMGVLASKTANQLGVVASRLAAVSAAATAAGIGIAGALFKGAIDSSLEFDKVLTEVGAVAGATGDQLDELKKTAEDGAAATKFTAVEAAQGLGELARATGDAKAAMAALRPTLDLARAGGLGVAEAATILTTTLTQFGLSATEASRVADLLATEANTTSDTVQGLGLSLSYVAPLAKQLGLSAKDTVAVLGALADQGFRGERAGTALRSVFSELLDPASEFAKALRDLGINSTDFGEILTQLATKGDAGRDAILKLDAAARPAILSLVSAGGEGLRKLTQDLDGASGAAGRIADTMNQSLNASVQGLKISFDQLRRDLVEPLLQPLAAELGKLSSEFTEFAQSPDFASLKEALAGMFHEGAEAAKELVHEVDFKQVAQSLRSFVVDGTALIGDIKDNLGGIVQVVETVGDVISTVFNAAQTTIFGVATAVSFAVENLAKAIELMTAPQRKLLELFGIQDEFSEKLKEIIGGMGAVTDEFKRRTLENVGETTASVVDLATAAETGADRSTAALDRVAASQEATATATHDVAAASEEAADGLSKEAAAAAGASSALDQVASDSDEAASRLKAAFADLGLQSQSELEKMSDSAKRNFDIIVEAARRGTASQTDVKRAFEAYAEAARKSVADSEAWRKAQVEAQLSVARSAVVLRDNLDEAGAIGERAGQRIAAGADEAAGSLSHVSDESRRAADENERLADASERASRSFDDQADSVEHVTAALGDGSKAFHEALNAANQYALTSQTLFANSVNRTVEQRDAQLAAINREVSGLQQQNAQFDETSQHLDELRAKYRFLSDEQLLGLANERKRLEENIRRRDEAVRRQAEAQQRDDAPASTRQVNADTASAQPLRGKRDELAITIKAEGGKGGESVISDEVIDHIIEVILARLRHGQSISLRRGG